MAVGADWLVALSVAVSNRSPFAALISKNAVESVVMFGLASQAPCIVSMTEYQVSIVWQDNPRWGPIHKQ